MLNPQEQFRDVMRAYGLSPPDEIEPGKFYRFPGKDKGRQNTAGWCKLFHDGVGGIYGDYSCGLSETWQAIRKSTYSPAEQEAFKRHVAEARAQAEAEQRIQHEEAAQKAKALWEKALIASDDHPYLAKKGIRAHGVRRHDDKLLIPMVAEGLVRCLQFIGANGDKRFLSGGRVKGCHFFIGNPLGSKAICIAEGFATGASIFEVTGYAVAVGFNAGNLVPVAKAVREQFPEKMVVLCADDDYRTDGNPGVAKAREAARAIGGRVAIPDFGAKRPEAATDFNDMVAALGPDAVRSCIEATLEGTPEQPAGAPEPGTVQCFEYGGGYFELSDQGLRFVATETDGVEAPPRWICSRLDIVAKTRDIKSGEWGRLLVWHDDDGVRHQWAMPMEQTQGDSSADVRRELARLGLSIAPGRQARDLLSTYLQICPVKARARCVDRLGWHGEVFVTSSESIGQNGEIVVFQNAHAVEPALAVSGTSCEWRDNVASLAVGNSRLAFALSVAFAGPLAGIVGEDSGGFHFRGASSSGKTTGLKAAASVWGDPEDYPRKWRATTNGLEGLAALHNDGLLILDEIAQLRPQEAGEAAYLLANGQGKARASRTGAVRQPAKWRLLFLSSGEESLSGLMARAGQKTTAGQEIRLADIDADARAGMGAFEELHGHDTPAALALAIQDGAAKYHGAVGMDWLRHIVADRPRLAHFIEGGTRQFVAEVAPRNAAGQVLRVARRFGLVAVAGELATHYGLTGWPEGEAIKAARKCFAAWLDSFGGVGNREERAMLAQVRAFFEAHGASRFEDFMATDEQRVVNRAGFFRFGADGKREFLVFPEAFKSEVCRGFDTRAVTRVLTEAGWLEPGKDGKTAQKPRMPGLGPTRCYVFTARMWEDE